MCPGLPSGPSAPPPSSPQISPDLSVKEQRGVALAVVHHGTGPSPAGWLWLLVLVVACMFLADSPQFVQPRGLHAVTLVGVYPPQKDVAVGFHVLRRPHG